MSEQVWLVVFLIYLVLQRVAELVWSTRTSRWLKDQGAVEFAPRHFSLIVGVHILFPIMLSAEVIGLLGYRWVGFQFEWRAFWCGVWVAAQGLRYWAIVTLGNRWNVRIFVIPGVRRIVSGPYRWLRHPNYLAVVLELLAAPMMFGAWRTALLISALNGAALWVRISQEERALSLI